VTHIAWYLTQIDLFAGLPDAEIERIATRVVHQQCTAPQQLYRPDVPSDAQIFIVKEGEVLLYHVRDGRRFVFDVLGPGSVFGSTSLLPETVTHFAEAQAGSRYCILPLSDVQALIVAHPDILLRLLGTLSQRVHDYEQKLSLDTGTAAERVLGELKRYQKKRYPLWLSPFSARLPLTHEKLATLTGLNRVTVTRALQALRASGDVAFDAQGAILLPQHQ
jgi:CRP/FNR family transcriptional regulator